MTEQRGPLYTTEVGSSGERVVFLHGLFGQGKNFRTVARELQPQFRSLLVDLPNHGRSEWTEHVDYVQMADTVAEMLRADFAADGPIHLVGHSMGGKVAMTLALRHPDLVDRLVVVDISPQTSADMSEFKELLAALATLDLSDLPNRTEGDARLTDLIPNESVRGFLLQNLRVDGDGWRWQANLDLLRREIAVIAGGVPDAPPFEHPVLWFAGELSDYVKPEDEPRMRELFPLTITVRVKGAGHWVHSQKPEAFISGLRAFLSAG